MIARWNERCHGCVRSLRDPSVRRDGTVTTSRGSLEDNTLYQAGTQLIPAGLPETSFMEVWQAAGTDQPLLAVVTPTQLQEVAAALTSRDPLRPFLAWSILLVRVAADRGWRLECTAHTARTFHAMSAAMDQMDETGAARVGEYARQIFEAIRDVLDPSDRENYETVLWVAARAYERSDPMDETRLRRSGDLLEQVHGPLQAQALLDLSRVALELRARTGTVEWAEKAFRAADRAVSSLDPRAEPDQYARARHQRGLARLSAFRTPGAWPDALQDLEAAWAIWKTSGSPQDQWTNRAATAYAWGLGERGDGTQLTATAIAKALDCYEEALRIARGRFPAGLPRLLDDARTFLERILGGPLPARLAALTVVWERAPDALLAAIHEHGPEFDAIGPRSMWTPILGIPADWRISVDAIPADRPDTERHQIVRYEYVWADRAALLCRLGLHGKVLAELERYVVEHPDDADGWYQLGVLDFFAGHAEKARTRVTRALQLRPGWRLVSGLLDSM